jgi:trans-aconitate 2-methyltransferase
MSWNPDQYARFREERAQPFHDLLALVRRRAGMRVVDLGCGPGELTRHLHDELQAAATIGVDSSREMLARSGSHAGGGVSFVCEDIASFTSPSKFDLVFSNAALQWLPDHRALFARLRDLLDAEGQLAVQMPANFDHPSHRLAADIAVEDPFRAALGGYTRSFPVLPPEDYAILLHDLGFRQPHVRLQVYLHLLESRDQVVEWVKGTLLTDYQSRLSPDLYAAFLERYRERLMPALSAARPYPYPFKRILLCATL